MFGLDRPQIKEAGQIARTLGEEWKGLVAGADGFLVGRDKEQANGSWEEQVVWGAMVRFTVTTLYRCG